MLNILLSMKLFLCKVVSKPVFIIEIKNSKVKHIKGVKHVNYINDCEEIARENGLTRGLIYAIKNTNGRTSVRTSSEIPAGSAQRFRNVWSFYA